MLARASASAAARCPPASPASDQEAAPLPGRSQETLEATIRALEALGNVPDDLARAAELLPVELLAARHALECALLELRALARGVPAFQVCTESAGTTPIPERLEVAGLVDQQDLEAALASARRWASRGLRVVKLKIGNEPVASIEARVRAIASEGLRVRLDANQTLSEPEARELARVLPAESIEFMEEPARLASWPPNYPLPLAADESLAEPGLDLSLLRAKGARAVVLKPMLLGGITPCLELARAASTLGLEVVVSHTFDGPLAMAAARSLALALGARRPADGLAPHAVLGAWPGALPEHVISAEIRPWQAAGWGLP